MLERLGLDILDLGIVRDQPEELERAVQMAVAQGDAVITTGGVSVGEADYVSELVARLGRIDFSRVAIKPGRAFVFGYIDAVPFFRIAGESGVFSGGVLPARTTRVASPHGPSR
ncbi:MAG: molybdopterin-binding protein [Gammaproteobacteria bacterium]|nr:molybdopterin-binding protein [Gammaproteobacteria bacterium]